MRYDVVVIGAGAMGAAAAYGVARRGGESVALLERFAVGHDRGSSHGASRIIRLTYDHPVYVRLAREAYAAWEAHERESGTALFHRTGDLFFGPAGGRLGACAASLEAAGVRFERLGPDEAARRFPAFRLPPGHAGLHQPDAGILPAALCVRTLLERARARGAEVLENAAVRAIRRDGPGPIRLETDRGAIQARRLVVAAGAWTARLLPELALPISVQRQRVAYYVPTGPAADFRPDRCPVFVAFGPGAAESDDMFYGVPIFERFGVKVARHRTHGPGVDPDAVARTVAPGELDEVRAFLRAHLPALAAGDAIEPHVCLYSVLPGEHFALGLHPDDPRIAVASPCSGHGFKFAAAIGEILADLALDGAARSPAYAEGKELFSPARFRATARR